MLSIIIVVPLIYTSWCQRVHGSSHTQIKQHVLVNGEIAVRICLKRLSKCGLDLGNSGIYYSQSCHRGSGDRKDKGRKGERGEPS